MLINSINRNGGALEALQAFNGAGMAVQRSQQRVATGLKIASAKDDGAAWSIAQTMRGKVAAWKASDDSLARGQTVASVGAAGASQVVDLLMQIQAKVLAFQDPSTDPASKAAYQGDIQQLVSQIDRTAKSAEFGGLLPLADALSPVTVTTTTGGYNIPSSSLAPPSLTAALGLTTGQESQTFSVNGGTTAGRIDLYLEAYSMPDILEVYQNGVRVAATGQAYAPGGGAVGPGAAVSAENILSFDYNPANGQTLQFQFNANVNATGSAWSLDGVALQNTSSPVPSTTVTTSTSTVMASSATTYAFVSGADGSKQSLGSRPLTANALGLDSINWNDPAALVQAVSQAISTARDAATYFGEQQNLFDGLAQQNRSIEDKLTAGIGNLIDADMGHESASLQAAQARQQLAARAMAIANSQPQVILALFQ